MSVPKLRFKDENGQDFPDLEVKKLEEIANVERGKFSVRPRNDPKYFGGNIPFVQTGDIVSSDLYLTKFSQTLNEDGLKVSRLFPKGTILVTIAANIGDTTITSFEVACTDSVVAIQSLQNCAVPVWLKYAIDTKKEELDSKATQNAQRNINLQVLRPLIFNTPTVQEQSKIADFLMAVDEKIAQLTQKCELLVRYKKGVMQQIFSQELRFKDDDGRDFPDWEDILLGEIINFENGKAHESSITDNGHYIVVNSKFISSNGTVIKRSNNAISPLKKDNIVMVMSDVPNGKALAKCYFIECDNKYTLNQRICSITSDKAISKFLFYQINRNPYYLSFDNGVGQTNLRKDDVLNCPIMYPVSLDEQAKIANFLTSIDEKITEAQTYLDTVKQYKQGLLQQMFV